MAFYRDLVCRRVRSVSQKYERGYGNNSKVLRHTSLAGVAVADYAVEQGHWVYIERFGARRACRGIVSISSIDISAILFIWSL
jgi:hypothetical protein